MTIASLINASPQLSWFYDELRERNGKLGANAPRMLALQSSLDKNGALSSPHKLSMILIMANVYNTLHIIPKKGTEYDKAIKIAYDYFQKEAIDVLVVSTHSDAADNDADFGDGGVLTIKNININVFFPYLAPTATIIFLGCFQAPLAMEASKVLGLSTLGATDILNNLSFYFHSCQVHQRLELIVDNSGKQVGRIFKKGQELIPCRDDRWFTEKFKVVEKMVFQFPHCTFFSDLGDIYMGGIGVAQNAKEALKYYYLAANLGLSYAQMTLGRLYYEGSQVVQDYVKALKYFELAANQNDSRAQNYLGECHYYGRGVSQDYRKAVECYRRAAHQEDIGAQCNLGRCYFEGEGVTQNHSKAVKYYRLAANQGDASAQYDLAECYYDGEGVARNYTEAAKYYRLAANQGDSDAQYSLGVLYHNGEGVIKNDRTAVRYLQQAVDKGNSNAQDLLDIIHRENLHSTGKSRRFSSNLKRKSANRSFQVTPVI